MPDTPADPAASRNGPSGRQQLSAAAALKTAAIAEASVPRGDTSSGAIGILLWYECAQQPSTLRRLDGKHFRVRGHYPNLARRKRLAVKKATALDADQKLGVRPACVG